MIEHVGEGTWFVRRSPEQRPEAIVDRFGGGYRLRRFSLVESRRVALGIHVSLDLAETAWWRRRGPSGSPDDLSGSPDDLSGSSDDPDGSRERDG